MLSERILAAGQLFDDDRVPVLCKKTMFRRDRQSRRRVKIVQQWNCAEEEEKIRWQARAYVGRGSE